MAKNVGVIKPHGTLEDLTFYKTQDGHLIRTKGGVEKARILTDPAFARTRENMSEFAQSASTGKVIRRGANVLMQKASDNRVTSRMAQVMHRILKLDTVNVRGQRTVAEGLGTAQGKELLKGFNFNINASLDMVLRKSVFIDELDQSFNIMNLIPAQEISYPAGATHVRLQAGALTVDLAVGSAVLQVTTEQTLPIDNTSASVVLDGLTPAAGTNLMLLLVEFLQDVNGVEYPLSAGFNALGVVDVLEV